MTHDSSYKLLIFDTLSLNLKKVITDAPKECPSFDLISPKYNEYFRMKLFLFRKTYIKILKNLSQYKEVFKKNPQNFSGKAYKTVVLIR